MKNKKEGSEESISLEAKDKVDEIRSPRTKSSKSISIDNNSFNDNLKLKHNKEEEKEKKLDKDPEKDETSSKSDDEKDKPKHKLHKKKGKKKQNKMPRINLQNASETKEEIKRVTSSNPFELFQFKAPSKKWSESSLDKLSNIRPEKSVK